MTKVFQVYVYLGVLNFVRYAYPSIVRSLSASIISAVPDAKVDKIVVITARSAVLIFCCINIVEIMLGSII